MSAPLLFTITAAAALAVNLVLIPLILIAAHRHHLFDRIDYRKAHTGQIPALGGIGIFFSFAAAGIVALLLVRLGPSEITSTWRAGSIAAGVTLMHCTGVVDDMIDIRAGRKLLLQIGAALLVVTGGTMIGSLELRELGFSLPLGILAPVLTVLWIVAISNAMNLIDGIDGFAGGVALFAALALGVIALARGDIFTATVAGALTGAVAGFLVFNIPPARIFMGDGGSLFLGFSLAVLSILGNGSGVPILVPLILLSVPILDTLTAILRRLRHRRPIHAPDANHFHHRLVRIAGSGRRALLAAYALNTVTAAGAISYSLIGGGAGLVVLLIAAAVVLSVFFAVFRLRPAVYEDHAPRQM